MGRNMGYYYYYYGARRDHSVFDGLTLSPLPYPVLVILAVISIFLGISYYSSYEDAVEAADESINWLLLAIPITILLVVRWLSSMEDSKRQKYYCGPPPEGRVGISPWAVAALIVLLLVLINANPSS